MLKHPPFNFFLFFFFLLSSSFNVYFIGATTTENPFTAKAALIRYWNRQIQNNISKPSFLLSKASPLSAIDSATITKLVEQKSISTQYQFFCAKAKLLCFSDVASSLEKHNENVEFASYSDKNFTNYGNLRLGGIDSFTNYSMGENLPTDSFRRYSRGSNGHAEKFSTYVPDGNVVDGSFTTYGSSATGGTGEFKSYAKGVNVPNLRFTSYNADSNGHKQGFDSYSDQTNSGSQDFTSYGKNGNGVPNDFKNYGQGGNVIASGFTGYGEQGNGAVDTFTAYAFDSNNPKNNFASYSDGGNAGSDSFTNYRDQANVGDDTFTSYAKNANSGKVNFANYGKSFNEGTDVFKGYAKGSVSHSVGFKIYGVNNTFKDYARKGVTFTQYSKSSSSASTNSLVETGKLVNRWVEPGKFFHESMLKEGTLMPMPDIKDKMPQRSFLPRTISSKLPFSTQQVSELKHIFHAMENSTMERLIQDTLDECERKPSAGESKKCVGSVEDMIDFAVSVLGHNVVVRSTESVQGSKKQVMIGAVKGINGGKVTKSVSCHQSLFPYLVYYCHSVPKVRVYEADILDAKTKAKINQGVAICHLDTTAWSPSHGAFAALGSRPGLTEVCHWIFENDMTWTTAD